MRISIAMCTYNGAKHLDRQLESIAAQKCLPSELVICDDCSTDATADIVRQFAERVQFPVAFQRNKRNLGSTRNFEQAIHRCTGDFIALCDQDDVWMPEKLDQLSAVLASDPSIGGVFSDGYLVNDVGARLPGRLWTGIGFFPQLSRGPVESGTLLRHNVTTGATLMFRADLRSRILPIDATWIHDGWIAWMLVLYSQLTYLSRPLIEYRIHAAQQVGLAGNTSIIKRMFKARAAGSEPQRLLARQFRALHDFWMEHPGKHYEARLNDFAGKIEHAHLRGELSRNRLMRLGPILRNYRGYRSYSLGFVTMAKDLLR